jgi:hypothetical protein
MKAFFFSNPRTKVNTVKHAVFLEAQVKRLRLQNSNVLARWALT